MMIVSVEKEEEVGIIVQNYTLKDQVVANLKIMKNSTIRNASEVGVKIKFKSMSNQGLL